MPRASARLLAGVIVLLTSGVASADEASAAPPAPVRADAPPAQPQKPPPAVLLVPAGVGILLPLVVPTATPRARADARAAGTAGTAGAAAAPPREKTP
jgi:hypothetical protein